MATRRKPKASILLSCEHARNAVPRKLQALFKNHTRMLASHRGYDEGALALAKIIKRTLRAPLFEGAFSRLVIDLNRSWWHPKALSDVTRELPEPAQEALIATIHRPFRERFQEALSREVKKGRLALHLSIHTFTPAIDGEVRNCEIGILYDPRRPFELALAHTLKAKLATLLPEARVRMNYPYLGTNDGHTTGLRKLYGSRKYFGMELEVNQGWLRKLAKTKRLAKASQAFARALSESIDERFEVVPTTKS